MILFHELQIPSDFDENKNYLEKWTSKDFHKMLDGLAVRRARTYDIMTLVTDFAALP